LLTAVALGLVEARYRRINDPNVVARLKGAVRA
jgi:hypothetical protein